MRDEGAADVLNCKVLQSERMMFDPYAPQDITELERRCHAAEARHQELTAKLPEATRPLLRQIESMQSAAAAQSEAWEAAEQLLMQRIAQFEINVAGASERERAATERVQALQVRPSVPVAAAQLFFISLFNPTLPR